MSQPKSSTTLPEQLLGLVVVDERRLQRRADLHVVLDGHLVLRQPRVDPAERVLDHVAGVLDQRERARARREDEELPVVEPLARSASSALESK